MNEYNNVSEWLSNNNLNIFTKIPSTKVLASKNFLFSPISCYTVLLELDSKIHATIAIEMSHNEFKLVKLNMNDFIVGDSTMDIIQDYHDDEYLLSYTIDGTLNLESVSESIKKITNILDDIKKIVHNFEFKIQYAKVLERMDDDDINYLLDMGLYDSESYIKKIKIDKNHGLQ